MADSIGGVGFTSGKDKRQESLSHWWDASPDEVANALSAYCASLELSQRPQRFRGYAYHMVATGRAPISYGLAMPGQGHIGNEYAYAGDLFDAEFTPPSENICSIAISTFENKIWCQRPHGQWIPPNDDNYKIRKSCKEAQAWTDQVFEDLNVWDLVQAWGKDSGIVGTGWLLGIADEVNHKIQLERVDDDCVLIDPTAGENPRAYQLRWFRDRSELIQQYAVGERADEIRAALEKADGCRLGFFQMPVGYHDTLALCVGWYCKRGSSDGRYVVSVDNTVLVDKPYKHEKPPLEKMVFERIPGSVRGRGPVEIVLPIQRELDRTVDNTAEQERVCAWNRVQTRVGNNVDPDTLSGNNIIEYTVEPVKFEQGIAPPPQLYQKQKDLKASGLFSVGISEQQVQGQAGPGVTAAVAMQSEMQISDVRHRSVSLQQENAVERLLKLIVRLGEEADPEVSVSGKKVDFKEVKKAVELGKVIAYPLSGLPQSIPGRLQEIEDQYKRGQIDRALYQRLKGLPTLGASNDEQTAAIDLIYCQLDEMIETGKLVVPLAIQDLVAAKDKTVRRIQVEARKKLPRDRIQVLSMFLAIVEERLQEQGPAASNANSQMQQPPVAPPTQAPAAQAQGVT